VARTLGAFSCTDYPRATEAPDFEGWGCPRAVFVFPRVSLPRLSVGEQVEGCAGGEDECAENERAGYRECEHGDTE